MHKVIFATQVELGYPFHRAYEKGGVHAVVFDFFCVNSAHWVQKHDDRVGVQRDTTTATNLMVTLSIKSQYQRDVQVLADVLVNDKEEGGLGVLRLCLCLRPSVRQERLKLLEFIVTPKNRNVLQVFAFDKNVRVGLY